jgi:DNA-binding NarL/FixJ family response regulator
MSIRVVLADDHPVVRQGLGALLGAVEGIEVVAIAADGDEAVQAAVEYAPDVLVIDIHMPGLDGITATREIREQAPTVAILMLTMLADDDTVRAAIHAGAAGYLLKGASRQQIVRAIQTVAAGDIVLDSGVAEGVLHPASPTPSVAADPLAQLTARERQVLGLVASGLRTAAIAARLGLATKTVNNNLSTIFAKLGVSNRTEAAVLAHQARLDQPTR